MRKLLLASVIAIASAAALATPADARTFASAGSGYFGFGPFGDFYDSYGPYPFYGPYWGGPYYDSGPGAYDGHGGGYVMRYPHAYQRQCRTEMVRHWRNHHWVWREARVCG
ncbi:hypothetical protein SAMN03159463_02464 [Mesorhizobium sp. NFR06]|uniref:hypothetical protein n=1 Tax=Mesorhizobium sp. NFR06 TaxID=1566290 RepID=UPI0008E07B0F|nr:hypothetical protein [Mesorhizobium sp. NFR06]SFO64266.1 hypothetical protein SAMN03159463_02464 [Mesorhizobium sp. NFR06]